MAPLHYSGERLLVCMHRHPAIWLEGKSVFSLPSLPSAVRIGISALKVCGSITENTLLRFLWVQSTELDRQEERSALSPSLQWPGNLETFD